MPSVAHTPLHRPFPLTLTPLYPAERDGAETMELEMLDGALNAAMMDYPSYRAFQAFAVPLMLYTLCEAE